MDKDKQSAKRKLSERTLLGTVVLLLTAQLGTIVAAFTTPDSATFSVADFLKVVTVLKYLGGAVFALAFIATLTTLTRTTAAILALSVLGAATTLYLSWMQGGLALTGSY
jgi:hypothetical protein